MKLSGWNTISLNWLFLYGVHAEPMHRQGTKPAYEAQWCHHVMSSSVLPLCSLTRAPPHEHTSIRHFMSETHTADTRSLAASHVDDLGHVTDRHTHTHTGSRWWCALITARGLMFDPRGEQQIVVVFPTSSLFPVFESRWWTMFNRDPVGTDRSSSLYLHLIDSVWWTLM